MSTQQSINTLIEATSLEALKRGLVTILTTINEASPSGGVQSVSGTIVDNADPLNPIVVSPITEGEWEPIFTTTLVTDAVNNKSTYIATDMFVDFVCNVTVQNAELTLTGARLQISTPDGLDILSSSFDCNFVVMIANGAISTLYDIIITNETNIVFTFSDLTPPSEYNFIIMGRYKRAVV